MFLISDDFWLIKKAGEKGLGIFSKKEIRSGTIIGDYLGKIINFRGLKALGIALQVYMSEQNISMTRKYVFAFAFIRRLSVHGVLRANIKTALYDLEKDKKGLYLIVPFRLSFNLSGFKKARHSPFESFLHLELLDLYLLRSYPVFCPKKY